MSCRESKYYQPPGERVIPIVRQELPIIKPIIATYNFHEPYLYPANSPPQLIDCVANADTRPTIPRIAGTLYICALEVEKPFKYNYN